MKTYAGEDVQIRAFLTSALVGGEWSASRPIPGHEQLKLRTLFLSGGKYIQVKSGPKIANTTLKLQRK
jgi:hypothetical protein